MIGYRSLTFGCLPAGMRILPQTKQILSIFRVNMIRAVLGEKHSFDFITLSLVLVGVHFIPDLNTHTGVSFFKKI